MNGSHTLPTHGVVLAAGSATGVWAFVIGLVVVLVLIGGFWLGFRRRSQEKGPPSPDEHPQRPERTSHVEGTSDANDTFPLDGGRLLPHELGGHGEDVRPVDRSHERGHRHKPS
jgi:LPXTG-motif cell wall-anchored protein